MFIGEKISYYRKKMNLTQEILSEGICTKSLLSKIENNRAEPSPDILKLLLSRMGLDDTAISEEDVRKLKKRLMNWYYLLVNRQYDTAREQVSELETAIEKALEPELEILFKIFKSKLCRVEGDLDEAETLLRDAYQHQSQFNWEHEYYYHYNNGVFLAYKNNLAQSTKEMLKALSIGEENGRSEYLLCYNISNNFYDSGHYANAILYGHLALEKALGEHTENFFLEIKSTLALAYSRINEGKRAIDLMNQCLYQMNEKSGHMSPFTMYHNLGCIYFYVNQYENARQAYQKAFDCTDLFSEDFCLNCLFMAVLCDTEKDRISAMDWLEKGLLTARKYNYQNRIVELKALKHSWSIDHKESLDYIKDTAIPFLLEYGEPQQVLDLYDLLVHFYKSKKQSAKALRYSNRMNALLKKLYNGVL